MDTKVKQLVEEEAKRQQETISLIPSENYASKAIQELVGSPLMNKYSEGYPGRRYYQGNNIIDSIEKLAIERAKELFGVPHANVQPYSGSPANSAVLFATCNPQDTIIGLELSSGGHLTHGHPAITFSGKFFKPVQFSISEQYKKMHSDTENLKLKDKFDIESSSLIDYEELESIVKESNPKLMIIGTTAYPLFINWQRLGEMADVYGFYLVADISHVAGLVVVGEYPSPVNWAHIVTTTTHKTLRGPRGAMIMVTQKGLEKDTELDTKVDRAVFPGLQGGPHDHTTAAIAQCLFEASQEDFIRYGQQVVINAKIMAKELIVGGQKLVGGGTDCHLILVDLSVLNLSGNVVAEALEIAGIVANRNSIPGDKSPFYPSGLRLGTPAVTTRGMKEKEMKVLAKYILKVIDHVKDEKLPADPEKRSLFMKEFRAKIKEDLVLLDIQKEVKNLCERFPII